ncbi:hypothetical protein ACHAP8_004690 [Fusarium lateritium]
MPHALNNPRSIEPHFLRNALDVLIIGTGPASLSAALTLGRARRSVAFFYSDEHSRPARSDLDADGGKRTASVQTDMVAELKTNFKIVLFTNTAAKSVRESGMIFEVVDRTGQCWKGRKIILATGCHKSLLEIPGYKDLWGTKIAAVLITSDDEDSIDSAILSTHLARQYTPDITLLVNGLQHLVQHPQVISIASRGIKVVSKAIERFSESSPDSVSVEFTDGTKVPYGFVSHKPRSDVKGSFARELDLEMTPQGRVLVEGDFQETSIRGVFAAGRCATVVGDEAMEISSGMAVGLGANLQIAEDDASS